MNPRRCWFVSGPAEARDLLTGLSPERVVEVDGGRQGASVARRLLGRTFDAVVVDARAALEADLLGAVHGLVGRGGVLVVLWPADGPPTDPTLAVWPATPEQVGRAFGRRVADGLGGERPGPWAPAPPTSAHAPTPCQDRVLSRLRELAAEAVPLRAALLSDRGRGKSTTLGWFASTLSGRVALTSPEPGQVHEVLQRARVCWQSVDEVLVSPPGSFDALLVDEAAGFPLPVLRALHERHPGAHQIFATTTRGYEGSGGGFTLRFLNDRRSFERLELHTPTRWDEGDPLERRMARTLAWDVEVGPAPTGPAEVVRVDRRDLERDEGLLEAVMALLVHAHYRTTPSELQRLLDAPNLELLVARAGGTVIGVNVLAREGGLPVERCLAVAAGRERLRGHVLPDTLICHSGHTEAGALDMVRSVRLAVHPGRRREGLAGRLADLAHGSFAPDLFGTVFGATPELLALRRAQGYALVRLGASAGARSGEVSVVMARPRTVRAASLVAELRAELARDLPLRLALLASDLEGGLDPALEAALRVDPATPAPFDLEGALAGVAAWLDGPRPYESAASAVAFCLADGALRPERVSGVPREVLDDRVGRCLPWKRVARRVGGSVPAAMRALKTAVRTGLAR